MNLKKLNIVTIHGIESHGDILEAVAYEALNAMPDDNYSHGIVTPIDYPRVRALFHHFPFHRKAVEWGVARRLHEIALMYPDFDTVVLCHSNGSRALSRVLETAQKYYNIKSYKELGIQKVILFGSIISRNYDFSRFPDIEFVNFAGTKDKAVLFSRGWSGRYGFKNSYPNLQEYKFNGGHSDYSKFVIPKIMEEVQSV